ncbi:hypothetical protein P9D96_07970 [Bacillus mojavensis]|uniref:hypothetical protein n=1 Tax=Bacillus mojavensis TaxID=72360 RepID=UPI002DBE2B5C|nr:hypothetical protein [Bacillus mojavensis]MEC1613153.1 hypothetical protein [Bacillus mojavensis]
MSFETKYLIRWGIPGWMLIFWIGTYFAITETDYISAHLKFSELEKLIGIFISLSVFGVVIGYIIHHLYFVMNWIYNKNRIFDNAIKRIKNFPESENWKDNNMNDYFHFEVIWHENLLKIEEEKRNYIVERYRYLLSTIHALGTVFVSHFIALLFTVIASVCKYGFSYPLSIAGVLGIQVIILFITVASFRYYSANLNYFQGSFLNKMLKKEL